MSRFLRRFELYRVEPSAPPAPSALPAPPRPRFELERRARLARTAELIELHVSSGCSRCGGSGMHLVLGLFVFECRACRGTGERRGTVL
jgi:hypothetical protein